MASIRFVAVIGLVSSAFGLGGCGNNAGGSGASGILDMLATFDDADGDGFVEIPASEGVEVTEQVAIAIDNEISRQQAINLARTNLPDFVTDSVGLSANVLVRLSYPGGVTQTLAGGRNVSRFSLSFEVACPERIEVSVTVVANIPIVGRRTVQALGPYRFSMSEGGNAFACGNVVRVRTYIGENNQPKADATAEAMPDGTAGDSTGTGGTGTTGGGSDGRDDTGSGVMVGPSGTRRP